MFRRDHLSFTLLRGAGSSFAVKVAGTLSAFLLQLYVARVLGPRAFGDYIFALTIVNFLALIGMLGFDAAALRYIPSYVGRGEQRLLMGFLRRSREIVGMVSLIVAVLICVVVCALYNHLRPELVAAVLASAALLPLNGLSQLHGAVMQALKNIIRAQSPQVVVRPVLTICVLFIITSGFSVEPHAITGILANVISSAVVLVLMWVYVNRATAAFRTKETVVFETREWLRVAIPLLVVTGFNVVLAQSDILMIGYMLGTTDSGIYAVASRIAGLVGFVVVAVNAIAAPMIAELHAQGRKDELQRLLTLAARIVFVVSAVACGVLLATRESLISIFGSEFLAGKSAMAILLVAQLFNALTGSVGYLLTMTGNEVSALRILGVSALLNIIMNMFMIPLFGIDGAAVATTITTLMWNIAMYLSVQRRLGLDPSILVLKMQR